VLTDFLFDCYLELKNCIFRSDFYPLVDIGSRIASGDFS